MNERESIEYESVEYVGETDSDAYVPEPPMDETAVERKDRRSAKGVLLASCVGLLLISAMMAGRRRRSRARQPIDSAEAEVTDIEVEATLEVE